MNTNRIFISSVQAEVAQERAALVEYLDAKRLVRSVPFDAAPCMNATLADLDGAQMVRFIRTARRARLFPLAEDAPAEDLLAHLNLLNEGRPTNAAVLLFGKAPQRFLISSEVKCAHFHGTTVAKPIPSYQVYKGAAFQLVDQAVDFVLSKIALSVGTRANSVRAPVTYEIPKEVVTEAVVNAVAHRDYTGNASIQVMLFADRLEIWNPGRLSPPLTLERLRVAHPSVPANPLLAESLYLAEYIERMGTGTVDMIRRCIDAGLPEPEFTADGGFTITIRRAAPAAQTTAQPESQPESKPESLAADLGSKVLNLLVDEPLQKAQVSGKLGQKVISGRLNAVVRSLLAEEMIAYTLPHKPNSRLQKYRLTEKGKAALANLKSGRPDS